jgi:hypothetical protein
MSNILAEKADQHSSGVRLRRLRLVNSVLDHP